MPTFKTACCRATCGVAALTSILLSAGAGATSMPDLANAGIDIIPRPAAADVLSDEAREDGNGIRPTPVNASILLESIQGDLHRLPLALLHDAPATLPAGSATPPIVGVPVLSQFD
ncbi:MAG: hypothetical protein HOJ21_10545, partial [Alphaproteobacteria bacterium]|nr:hypothetical protein [Alphaproteobacteria bacterium]